LFDQWLEQLVNAPASKELITIVLAMIPIAELRGALPISVTVLGLPWYQAFYLSIIGNLIPVPFLLLFFGGVSNLVQKTSGGKRFIDWLLRRTRGRSKMIEKYKWMGLFLFVAVPLPFTGAWTASLASYLLNLRFWPAFFTIFAGVAAAAVIVTTLTLLGWIGAGIAIAAILILAVLGLWKL
jgi:uncharacterized membrane protein